MPEPRCGAQAHAVGLFGLFAFVLLEENFLLFLRLVFLHSSSPGAPGIDTTPATGRAVVFSRFVIPVFSDDSFIHSFMAQLVEIP